MQDDTRSRDDRRYAAVSSLNAIVECLKSTNPSVIFNAPKGLEAPIDQEEFKRMGRDWAKQASGVLSKALQLAEAIGDDGLSMFKLPEQKQGL
jgi:hypothetical protein